MGVSCQMNVCLSNPPVSIKKILEIDGVNFTVPFSTIFVYYLKKLLCPALMILRISY